MNELLALLGPKIMSQAQNRSMGADSKLAAPMPEPKPYQEPTGLFGVKGTFRDILGVLGQGLTNGRFNYGDLRRQEKLAKAYHEGGPEAVMQIDPKTGRELMKAMQEQQQAANKEHRESADFYDTTMDRVGQMLGMPGAQENWERVRPQIQRYIDSRKVDLTLPEKYDPALINQIIYGGYSTKDRIDDEQARQNEMGRNERAEMQEEGRMTRWNTVSANNSNTQSNANWRNQNSQAGADRRNAANIADRQSRAQMRGSKGGQGGGQLPDARSHKGRTIELSSGVRLKSNGSQWVPQTN